ncbi:MAG: hypothetical protein P9L92_01685 [Candidatus Electryonea clarkiae]|nr:hypothetical protein [Candidatus Electryonea clarkiae]MDP8285378.1 hypothetical protein [Candidatus Electryonea clarkiae]
MWKDLLPIVESFTLSQQEMESNPEIVLTEAYLPFFPEKWNGILVLSESQNLSNSNKSYVDFLKNQYDSKQRMMRLNEWYASEGKIFDLGVQPWDDMSIPLALKSIYPDFVPGNTAVGNAVPWSAIKGKANINPTDFMNQRSISIWNELLNQSFLKDNLLKVITVGKLARNIMIKAEWQKEHLKLRSASNNYIGRISSMFKIEDLLIRYPEVKEAAEKLGIVPTLNKTYFACHAVSLYKN